MTLHTFCRVQWARLCTFTSVQLRQLHRRTVRSGFIPVIYRSDMPSFSASRCFIQPYIVPGNFAVFSSVVERSIAHRRRSTPQGSGFLNDIWAIFARSPCRSSGECVRYADKSRELDDGDLSHYLLPRARDTSKLLRVHAMLLIEGYLEKRASHCRGIPYPRNLDTAVLVINEMVDDQVRVT